MIGLLLNPTKADVSPEGLLPHEGAICSRARIHASPAADPHVPAARLKHLLSSWITAASAYRERQAALLRRIGLAIAAATTSASTAVRSMTRSKEPRACASGGASSRPEQKPLPQDDFPTSAFQTKEI